MADSSTAFLQSLFANNGVGSDPALNAAQKTIAQNDYWRTAAAPILGAQFDRRTWTPTQSAGVSAAQSFIGSLLNSLGANSEAKQMQAISAVLPQIYENPSAVMRPEGVDPEAFAGLQVSATRDQFSQRQQLAQALATKGVRINEDGSWGSIPGARDALNALDGASPELQAVEVKIRSGEKLTEADNKILAAAPEGAKRILGQIEYQRAIDKRNDDVNTRQEKGFEFQKGFDKTINRELLAKQNAVDAFLTQKEGIAQALDKFDPNESIAGAIGRGITAGWVKDSEAADLKRQIDQVIFAMLKPTFPGQISDQERQVLQAAAGGDMGVPISTLKKIFDRQENYLLKNVNKDLNRALAAGYQVPLEPMRGLGDAAPSAIPEGAQPTNKTSGGKPVYIVNGKYWVPD
jgi:hypothetical protein